MEKIITVLTLSFALLGLSSKAQYIPSKGLVKTYSTIALGKVVSQNNPTFYLHGSLEYFTNKKISIVGDSYLYQGSLNEKEVFDKNHNLFCGVNYHLFESASDVYIGIQPGVSFTKLKGVDYKSNGVNPVFAASLGYTYYVNRIFNFFIQARYIVGNHTYGKPINLNEVRVSAGLGLHLGKKKKH